MLMLLDVRFFFFQAEDGIRDVAVTGVQTCALPISRRPRGKPIVPGKAWPWFAPVRAPLASLCGPPNIATRPRAAPHPARISPSAAPGNGPANKALLPAAK